MDASRSGVVHWRMRIKSIRSACDEPRRGRACGGRLARCIRENRRARIIAATGASQIDFLDALTSTPGIDWSRVEMFHLDEYVGLPIDHPASFRRYLLDRLINKVGIGRYHLLDGEQDPAQVARTGRRGARRAPGRSRVRRHRRERPSRVQRSSRRLHDRRSVYHRDVGRGLPPAAGRRRLVRVDRRRAGSGDLDVGAADSEVEGNHRGRPRRAKSCRRESVRGRACLPMAPASILQTHPNTTLYLDEIQRHCSRITMTAMQRRVGKLNTS